MAGRGHLAAIYGGFPEGMGALVIEIITCERGRAGYIQCPGLHLFDQSLCS